METTFKYQGKIISTPNLEKKLKRMKITLDDIEIIDKPIKKSSDELEDYMLDLETKIVRSTEDDIRRVCYVPKNKSLPTIYELFKNQLWNGSTGIKGLTYEFLKTMYYDI